MIPLEMIEVYRIRREQLLATLRGYRTPFSATWFVGQMGHPAKAQVKCRMETPAGAVEGISGMGLSDMSESRIATCAREAVLRAVGCCFDEMNPLARQIMHGAGQVYGRPAPKRKAFRL